MLTYRDIIKLQYPSKNPVKFLNNTYAGIVWNPLDFTVNPTQVELDAAIASATLNNIHINLGENDNDPTAASIQVQDLTMTGNLVVNGYIDNNSNPISFGGNVGIILPVGNVAQRPTPTIGGVRYNTDTKQVEFAEEYPEGVVWKSHLQLDAVSDSRSFTGFSNLTSSVISFNNATRTFSIAPVSVSYEIYFEGTRIDKTGTDSVTIPNIEGLYYFYFDSTGTLQYSTTDWAENQIQVGWLYWATTQQIVYPLVSHRKGLAMSNGTANLINTAIGPIVGSGLNLTSYTLTGTGALNSDAQISINNGTWLDADIVVNITNNPTPSGPYEQVLNGPALIPIMYFTGAGLFYKTTATTFPLIKGTLRAQYDKNTGGTWALTDADEGYYVVTYIIATSAMTEPVFGILGDSQYAILSDAVTILDWADFVVRTGISHLTKYVRPLYALVYQTSSSYANTPHARLVDVVDLSLVNPTGRQIDHSNLEGLTRDDHAQYVHNSIARTITAQHLFSPTVAKAPFTLGTNAQGQLVTGLNADQLDGYESTYFQTGNVNLSALSNIATTGIYTVTGAGTSTTRSVTSSGSTITVSNGNGAAGNINVDLPNIGTPVLGAFTRITTDAQGRVSTTANITSSDITTTLGYTPYNATNPAEYITATTANVASFNTRTGAVTLTSGDVTTALTYTPYNSTNPANYITSSGAPVQSFNTRTGNITLTSGDVTTALTYSPVNKAGDTMSGNLNMGGFKISNAAAGTLANDYVTYSQLSASTSGFIPQHPIMCDHVTNDTLSTPPVSPVNPSSYIVGVSPTGAWSRLAGHLMEWQGTSWVDVIGRAVIVGDRFGINFKNVDPGQNTFAGKDDNIIQVTNATPGAYAYTYTTPVSNYLVLIDADSCIDAGHSYVYSSSASHWIEIASPVATNPGSGLSKSGSVLNVNIDSTTITTNGPNQLTLVTTGVAAGTYSKIAVDGYGRVTTGANIASSDVTTALTYTPYNATNPAGYITATTANVASFNTRTGNITLTSGDVTTALGYTPQTLNSNLTALSNTSTAGIYVVTGAGTSATRSITVPSGMSISNANGVAGNIAITLAGELSAVQGLATTGLAARTATGTWATRSIVVPTGMSIANADGVLSNPTISLTTNLLGVENISTQGFVGWNTGGTFVSRTFTGQTNQISISNGDSSTGNPTISIASNPVLPGTGAVTIPVGTNAQQPAATVGMLRYDTTYSKAELFDGVWSNIATEHYISSTISSAITLTGDVTGSGTTGVNLATTLATVNTNVGTFAVSTVNGKGLVTAAQNLVVSGDATGTSTGPNVAVTLNSVNSNVGQFGDSSHAPQLTVNAKGLITAAANVLIIPAAIGAAPLNSPGLTGTPTAPTVAVNTNTTQLATTAFVVGQAGTGTPLVSGTAATGTSLLYSRQDHVHPAATVGSGKPLQSVSASVAASSGTSTVALNNTTPTITTGTQIVSLSIVPSATTSSVHFQGTFLVDSSNNERAIYAFFFRWTTCIGSSSAWVSSAGSPVPLTFSFVDSPLSNTTTTYSIRVAGTTNTWYVAQSSDGARFGGTFANNDVILTELA